MLKMAVLFTGYGLGVTFESLECKGVFVAGGEGMHPEVAVGQKVMWSWMRMPRRSLAGIAAR